MTCTSVVVRRRPAAARHHSTTSPADRLLRCLGLRRSGTAHGRGYVFCISAYERSSVSSCSSQDLRRTSPTRPGRIRGSMNAVGVHVGARHLKRWRTWRARGGGGKMRKRKLIARRVQASWLFRTRAACRIDAKSAADVNTPGLELYGGSRKRGDRNAAHAGRIGRATTAVHLLPTANYRDTNPVSRGSTSQTQHSNVSSSGVLWT